MNAKTTEQEKSSLNQLPYAGIRVIQLSETLAGRLSGLLFVDQGAEVFFARISGRAGRDVDAYLDRGKTALPPSALADTRSADVVIVDGDAGVERQPSQIVLRIAAALPGDEDYGHLRANCSEDLLSATFGFFTDMALTGRMLGRPVIYTPLPLSSVYTGVIGAVAVGAALHDRVHSGLGREVTASRIAGALSAIGALAITMTGLPPHLAVPPPAGLPEGMTREQMALLCKEAATDASRQLWLEHRVISIGGPYRCADGRMVLVMSGANRRATQRAYEHLGIWKQLGEAGLVDESPYDPNSVALRGRNVADAPTLDFKHAAVIADMLERIMATKTAATWEAELCGLGIPAAAILTFQEWLADSEAHRAGLIAEVAGTPRPQLGRAAWLHSAQPYPVLWAVTQSLMFLKSEAN